MKKLLLSLGAIAAVVTPIASVVACGAPAKPAPIALDKEKVEKIVPQIKAAIESLVGGDATAQQQVPSISDGIVTPDGDNFKATFTISIPGAAANDPDEQIEVVISPEGDVVKIETPDALPIPPKEIAELKAMIKGNTVDHSQDTAAIEYNLVKADYDQDIVRDMDLEFPTIVASPSNDEKRTYNKETETFLAEYNELAGNAAYDVLSAPMTLSMTQADYKALIFSDGTVLTAANIDELGLPVDKADRLKSLIAGQVKITINKNEDEELAIFIEKSTKGESDAHGQISWFEGTDPAVGISFATA